MHNPPSPSLALLLSKTHPLVRRLNELIAEFDKATGYRFDHVSDYNELQAMAWLPQLRPGYKTDLAKVLHELRKKMLIVG